MKINNYPTLKEIEEKGCFYLPGGLVPVEAKCEKCGGQLFRDPTVSVSTYPPSYFYYCSKCGNNESSTLCLEIARIENMVKVRDSHVNKRKWYSVLKNAIATYGKQAQTLMFFEEVSELQKELCKNARGKNNISEIAEEVADVEIMLEQIKMMFNCRKASEVWKEEKLERLASRLKGARNDDSRSD